MDHLTPQQVAALMTDATRPAPVLLDVREAWEYDTARLAGTTSLPMSTLASRIAEIEALQEAAGDGAADDPPRSIVCICHHGARSMQVAAFLEHHGLANIINMTGGIHAWSQQVDPAVPIY